MVRGDMNYRAPLAILGFVVANIILSQLSFRATRPYVFEVARAVAGAVVAPGAYLLVSGPLSPWWPGFLIMCLGGSIVLGLITADPRWGRRLVIYYLLLLVGAMFLRDGRIDWYSLALNGGVVAMVGLLFAQIMSLLGQTLRKVHDRSVELAAARDALFAEVEVAHDIQTLLLPRDPILPGSTVRGKMLPAAEVGGDYYDVIDMHGGRKFIAIGDVSGHGVTSGLTMMMARSSLLGVLEANPDITVGEAYRVLNRALRDNLERMGASMYMTFALMESLSDGRFVGVGRHLPFMIYRAARHEVEELELEGMWLGVLDDLPGDLLHEVEIKLDHGDLLVLYTDGIIEHFAGGEMFGFDRLKSVIRDHAKKGADHVIGGILSEVESFGNAVEDDLTLFVIDHSGDPAALKPPLTH
ncbi:MAG TPA: SpoIIE family protein phosphatase [Kofleriaceae bacterium]|nr:SpoIIE family protein phosphatase [Kofleriaceae bacterium]